MMISFSLKFNKTFKNTNLLTKKSSNNKKYSTNPFLMEKMDKIKKELNFKFSVDSIQKVTNSLIENNLKINNESANLSQNQSNFKSVIEKLGKNDNFITKEIGIITFLQHISTDKNIRDISWLL